MNPAITVQYLIELRKRLMLSLIVLAALFLITCYFANVLYHWLALPLLRQLSHEQHLIATNMISAFFTPVEFAFYVAVFLAVPFFIYHGWAFVSPALYPKEKRVIWPLLFCSIGLFYLGIAFAYFVVFPLIFAFLAHAAPEGVQVLPDINIYLEFTLKLFLVFGVIFEVPIIVIALVKAKIVSREKLIHIRPYVIVGSFVVGMLLAPPDVLSQTLVALPLWWLYEVGVFIV